MEKEKKKGEKGKEAKNYFGNYWKSTQDYTRAIFMSRYIFSCAKSKNYAQHAKMLKMLQSPF